MTAQPTKPLFKFDRRAKTAFAPYRDTLPIRMLETAGDVGDQLQLRLLCAGMFVAGLVRGDGRMMRAGARMLLAHEAATLVKGVVKRQVDRRRPRSTAGRKASKPHKGRSKAKEQQSFPSGHSAGAAAVASAFAADYPEHAASALGAAGAVALAQVPTGAHYPSDIIAGSAIGAAASGALNLMWRALRRSRARRGKRPVA
jgi:undecaprenyl-diphosphatase